MDFKSLINKFDTKRNNTQDTINYSFRDSMNSNKIYENKNKLTGNNIKSNTNRKFSEQDSSNKCNENIRNTIAYLPNTNSKKDNNKFLSKINLFESKGNNNKQNDKKNEIVLERNTLKSPFMSNLDNNNRKNSKEINYESNIEKKAKKCESKDEKEKLKNINDIKRLNNEELKQNNEDSSNICNNNNIKNKDEKDKIEKNKKIIKDNDEVIMNQIKENKNIGNKNMENKNDIKNMNKKENKNVKNEIKNNEIKENNIKNKNEQIIINEINENINIENIKNTKKKEYEEINKSQDIDIVDIINNQQKNTNENIDNEILEKEQINNDLYNNIYEEEVDKKEEKDNERIKDKNLVKDNIDNKSKEKITINNKTENNKNNKIKEENKDKNIIINKEIDDDQDNFDQNLDITKLIKSKENLNIDNKSNFDEEGNLDTYFKQQNNNNGFEKTFSNIELINQKPSLYVEDEMNETLINLYDKNQKKENKNKKLYENEKEIKNNISKLNNLSYAEKTKKMKDFFEYDDENLVKTFNSEDFPIRRYDCNTIDSGKKFFRFRFIKNKIENYLKLSIIPSINNNSITSSAFLDKSLSIGTISSNWPINAFMKKSFTFKNELSISNMNKYDKEKEIRVYSSEFLKLVEKAIFSFNLKKYKESYEYLLKSGIIYNPKEYGEFLLVVSGFDKNIIGDFLSKIHPPNEKKEVLNSFTSCIDVEYPKKKLLECVRFLFTKVNLPKDANLILEIINSFSLHYFHENKDNKSFFNIFKTSNNVYLLLSTILAINTMFIRTDIRNLNAITKEDFVKMNKDVPNNVVENIYLELKNEPLSMIDDDYNQNIYKKLSSLVTEKRKIEINNQNDFENNNIFLEKNNNVIIEDNKKENDGNNIDDRRRKMTFSLSQTFQLFTKVDKENLSKPIKFLKFKGKNSSHYREFLVYDNFTKLIWAKSIDPGKIKGNIHFIIISDIIDVFNGINHSEIIQKYYNSSKEKDKNKFITIISSTRQIDLKADDLHSALSWFKALKSLVLKVKSKEEKKMEKQIYLNHSKLKNKIEMIWKNSILPKWGEYGNYLLMKMHEKKNDLYGLKLIDKNNNINTQINDDKISLSKKLELIMKEIDNKKILSESDFYSLYNLGLPFFVRRKIWNFLIGNPCNISQILYEAYVSQIEKVNFDTIDIKYHENVNEVFSCDYIINQMIIDIIKIKDLFLCELITRKLEQNEVMLQAYKIIRTFFMIRNDLTYNKNIIPLIFIFLILGENEFTTFSNIFNLICCTNTIKYLLGEDKFIKRCVSFFNQLIEKIIPRVFEHFKKLEITTELYLIPWFEEIFTGTLNYKILLRVLDLYLLNGDYILYQVGITIIKIQEEDILNSTISEVFRVLKRLPNKYKEDLVLEHIKELSEIKEKYFSWNKENILEEQKKLLYQDINEE